MVTTNLHFFRFYGGGVNPAKTCSHLLTLLWRESSISRLFLFSCFPVYLFCFYDMDPFGDSFHAESVQSPAEVMPPEPPCSPVFFPESAENNQLLEALKKQIDERTAAIDAASAEKEKAIEEAAKKYLETQIAEREKTLAALREENKKIQQAKETQLRRHDAGSVWKNIGMMMDLTKPNRHSKNTERMRSIFLDPLPQVEIIQINTPSF
eukprot:gene4113-2959_t